MPVQHAPSGSSTCCITVPAPCIYFSTDNPQNIKWTIPTWTQQCHLMHSQCCAAISVWFWNIYITPKRKNPKSNKVSCLISLHCPQPLATDNHKSSSWFPVLLISSKRNHTDLFWSLFTLLCNDNEAGNLVITVSPKKTCCQIWYQGKQHWLNSFLWLLLLPVSS